MSDYRYDACATVRDVFLTDLADGHGRMCAYVWSGIGARRALAHIKCASDRSERGADLDLGASI